MRAGHLGGERDPKTFSVGAGLSDMLLERVFLIGGVLTILLGVLLGVVDVAIGGLLAYPPLIEAAALMVGFGGFFLLVSRDARRERLRLLDLGDGPPRGPDG